VSGRWNKDFTASSREAIPSLTRMRSPVVKG
jgi:hypothetical protein